MNDQHANRSEIPCPRCGSDRVFLLAEEDAMPGDWGWACLACWHKWSGVPGPAMIADVARETSGEDLDD